MIHDRQDPSGQGMFSKSGRKSGDARSMLERVINHQVPNERVRKQEPQPGNTFNGVFEDTAQFQREQQQTGVSIRPSTAASPHAQHINDYSTTLKQRMIQAQKIEPFSKQSIRDIYPKQQAPQVSTSIDKNVKIVNALPDPHKQKPHLVWDILKIYKNQTKPRTASSNITPRNSQTVFSFENHPKKQLKKIIGFNDFKKQLNRFKTPQNQVNENRISSHRDSSTSLLSSHIRDYSFDKQLSRKKAIEAKLIGYIPDNTSYNPKFDVVKPSLCRNTPILDSTTPHKSLESKLVGVFQGMHYEYDNWAKDQEVKSNIYKKLSVIPFNRQLSRELNRNNMLPVYMQSGSSRISMQELSQKMLLENNTLELGLYKTNRKSSPHDQSEFITQYKTDIKFYKSSRNRSNSDYFQNKKDILS